MLKILLLTLSLLNLNVFAQKVSTTWGDDENADSVFFAQDKLYLLHPLTNNNNDQQPKANSYVQIFAGCIEKNNDWSCLDSDILVANTELTNGEYRKFDPTHNSGKGFNANNQPVVNITIDKIKQYLAWLNNKTEQNYRLPTALEWEYVTLAGAKQISSPSCSNANLSSCNHNQTKVVGSLNPNAWGVYDTIGNVAEMVTNNNNITIKGGSWNDDSVNIFANKPYTKPAGDIGLRLVVDK
jgi:formylglycine-generating enzyme required for sulfatase activity